ncbi:hypothetical protein GX50_08356 [[Emmonsia] crescens]|uniref:Uncharacterized protein n=1 Tax=[Emmonsia] crescens TaxID=73230 RepID=A0A2B7Z5P0_9EURO|nr:hypothetical protein GX50_08356 [Emmonsia crescens]
MLPHLLPYLTLTAIHLSTYSQHVVRCDANSEPARVFKLNMNNDSDIDQDDFEHLRPEDLEEDFRLMSEIPNKMLNIGSDATEKWLRKPKGHSKLITARS